MHSRNLLATVGITFFCCCEVSAQLPADSITHLFDFSSDNVQIHVDPLLDLLWTPAVEGNQTAWRNIRGATFSAHWDKNWSGWGSLEEHQSIRIFEESWWTAANASLPGWGKAKLGRDGAWRSSDSMYVDVARAMGGMRWNQNPETGQGWSVELAIRPFEWGIARHASTIGLRATSAPSPEFNISHSKGGRLFWLGGTKWILDSNSPFGALNQRIWEWTQSTMVGWDNELNETLQFRSIVGMTWSTASNRAGENWPLQSGWSAIGLKWENERFFGGLEAAHEALKWNETGWTIGSWRGLAEVQISIGPIEIGGTIFRREGIADDWASNPSALTLLTHSGLPLGQIWPTFTEFHLSIPEDSNTFSARVSQEISDWGHITKLMAGFHPIERYPVTVRLEARWAHQKNMSNIGVCFSYKNLNSSFHK